MNSIDDLLQPYSELETAIRGLMAKLFSDTCGMCTACCCRADICEEATDSAFLLKLLERQGLKADAMDERFGWLDLHGCSLEYGRPPICYEFFCDELLARLPDEESRVSARVLGKLLDHVGQKALGGWHLVEVMEAEDLAKVDLGGVSRRLEEAMAAYEVIEHYAQSGRLSKADHEILDAIKLDIP
ncbi:hypothetical protein PDESU_02845 [Pontiella desulfatans]|uniref:Uncharacterized protein n=1 Tax=Pontiella desulfatans TaxID=2750659 RepID=A0A6C2U4F8_PONDE|nr:hypothetical protein [Pontiella desulfatans]VGO14286.1 hypothetical protein PDESU_02845 [Pontiella desulfatans]